MSTTFSAALIKARKEAGFPTAYRFYHDACGASGLKISYRTYLLLEQGKLLPAFKKLHTLLLALHLVTASSPANELVAAWLKSMAGENSYDQLLKPLISAAMDGRGFSPLHKAVKKQLAEQRYYITLAQFRATLTDYDTYLCSVALANDTGVWSAESIAKALKLKVPAAEKAMETLARAKILKRVKKGQYMCPMASMILRYPQLSTVEPELRSRLRGYHNKLIDSGTNLWRQGITIRADSVDFHNFFPLLGQDIETASSYGITERTSTSAIYAVEAKVIKLLDF